jgi:MoxR-like ATPase
MKESHMTTHDCWAVTDAVMGVSQRILLYGPPGTGKTYAAQRRALTEDQTVYSITMTEETPMAEIRGHFVQKEGSFVWMDGPAVRSWKEGARLVINEIDRAGDDVLSFLYAIMDDPGFASVTLPTGETISPVDGFQLVATMNGEPDDLPDALQDRLPVSIEIGDLNPEALQRLPEDLQEPAKNTTLLNNDARRLSIRAWLEFAALRDKLGVKLGDEEGLEMAAQAVFGDRGHDAVLALQVADEASEPFTMAQTPKDASEAYAVVRETIAERAAARGFLVYNVDDIGDWDDIRNTVVQEVETAFGYFIDVRVDVSTYNGPKTAFKWKNPTGDIDSRWVFQDGTVL